MDTGRLLLALRLARPARTRDRLRRASLTVGWMAIEAAVAIGAGIAARSVLLTAIGADSLVGLLSGATLRRRPDRAGRALPEKGSARPSLKLHYGAVGDRS
jgi:hypothetical protein